MSSTSSQNCALQFPSVPFHFRFLSTPVHLCHYSVSAIVHLLAFNWHLLPLSFNRIRKELLNTLPNLNPPLFTGASCLRLHSTSLEMANSFFFFENIALFTSTCCNEPSCNSACSKDICVNRARRALYMPFWHVQCPSLALYVLQLVVRPAYGHLLLLCSFRTLTQSQSLFHHGE